MRKKVETMKSSEKAAIEAVLAGATKQLDNDANRFINSLLTERERLTIGRRLLIAHLILNGCTQMEINNRLSTSPNTHAKIKRWLNESLPTYEATNSIERSRLHTKITKRKNYAAPLSFAALKKNYPGHFLLFTISDAILQKLKNK